jgi:hypothetical protein
VGSTCVSSTEIRRLKALVQVRDTPQKIAIVLVFLDASGFLLCELRGRPARASGSARDAR